MALGRRPAPRPAVRGRVPEPVPLGPDVVVAVEHVGRVHAALDGGEPLVRRGRVGLRAAGRRPRCRGSSSRRRWRSPTARRGRRRPRPRSRPGRRSTWAMTAAMIGAPRWANAVAPAGTRRHRPAEDADAGSSPRRPRASRGARRSRPAPRPTGRRRTRSGPPRAPGWPRPWSAGTSPRRASARRGPRSASRASGTARRPRHPPRGRRRPPASRTTAGVPTSSVGHERGGREAHHERDLGQLVRRLERGVDDAAQDVAGQRQEQRARP